MPIKAGKTGPMLQLRLNVPLDRAEALLPHANAILTEQIDVELSLRQIPLSFGLSGRENGTENPSESRGPE